MGSLSCSTLDVIVVCVEALLLGLIKGLFTLILFGFLSDLMDVFVADSWVD